MKLTARIARSKDLGITQIKVWIRGAYIPGRGEVAEVCFEAYGGLEAALPTLWANASLEISGGARDEEGNLLLPFEKGAFSSKVIQTLKQGSIGMGYPDHAEWVEI